MPLHVLRLVNMAPDCLRSGAECSIVAIGPLYRSQAIFPHRYYPCVNHKTFELLHLYILDVPANYKNNVLSRLPHMPDLNSHPALQRAYGSTGHLPADYTLVDYIEMAARTGQLQMLPGPELKSWVLRTHTGLYDIVSAMQQVSHACFGLAHRYLSAHSGTCRDRHAINEVN